jgi:hypothetical protein
MGLNFGYADNDVGISTNTAYTNNVPLGQSTGLLQISGDGNYTTTNGNVHEILVDLLVPNGKYVSVSNGGGTGVAIIEVFGYEEA